MAPARTKLRDEEMPPSGRQLEAALLEHLRKKHFTGAEHVSVFVIGIDPIPIYLLNTGDDVAAALGDLLKTVLGRRPQPTSTEWVLFRADVHAILKALA
jgi:hypothetical protein